jgi:hypothetical protein
MLEMNRINDSRYFFMYCSWYEDLIYKQSHARNVPEKITLLNQQLVASAGGGAAGIVRISDRA